MVRSAVKEALEYAAEEAYRCGNARIEPLHLLIAGCRLVCRQNSGADLAKELSLLKDLFSGADVRPAELAERLRAEMHQEGQQIKGPVRECSKQLHEVFSAAKEYSAEQGYTGDICLRHLFESLFVSLCDNPVFKTIMVEAGGDIRRLREQLGLHESTIATQTSDEELLRDKNEERDGSKLPGQESTAPPCSSSSGRRAPGVGAIPLASEAIRDKFVRSDQAMRREDWAEAIRLYEQALEAFPRVSPAWNNLGVAYMRLRQFEEAKRSFKNAINLDPRNADAYANLGVLLGGYLQKAEEAEAYFKETLRINPNHNCRQYLENPQALREESARATDSKPRTVNLSQLLSAAGSQPRSEPHSRHHGMTVGANRSDSFLRRSSSFPESQPTVPEGGPSLKQLQHAANHVLLPKALTRVMPVCIFLGAIDVAVGVGFHKTSWLYFLLAALGGLLALEGILAKTLRRSRRFLEQVYILVVLGSVCTILFFSATHRGATSSGGMPWGQLVLLALLGPFQFRAASDCFSRYRLFAEMSTKPPSPQVCQRLEEIRKEIVNAKPDSDAEIVEFINRWGHWKGRLGPQVGTFVNVDLGDVLFTTKSKTKLEQPVPNGPAVLFQIGKNKISARMLEPSLSRMRKWCHK